MVMFIALFADLSHVSFYGFNIYRDSQSICKWLKPYKGTVHVRYNKIDANAPTRFKLLW